MTSFFELLKSVYLKEKIDVVISSSFCVGLTRTLCKEPSNLPVMRKIIPFLFYIHPRHYFYLLFLNIPKRKYVPRTFRVNNSASKSTSLENKIQKTLAWSSREMKYNQTILEKNIMSNQKYWKKQLGV